MLYLSLITLSSIISFIGYYKYKKSFKALQAQINRQQEKINNVDFKIKTETDFTYDVILGVIRELEEELHKKIENRSHSLQNQIEVRQTENIKNLKKILTNWENSEEFKMMLNSIRKKEEKINTGVIY